MAAFAYSETLRFRTILLPVRQTVIFLFLFAAMHCQAQKQDVVYLKNGGIIRGTIVQVKKDTSVSIETYDHSRWVCLQNDILKISRENALFQSSPHGYYNATQAGFIINNGWMQQPQNIQVCLSTTNGYRFCRYFAAGAFIAINSFDNYVMVPTGLEFRGDILKGRITPFYAIQGGKSWGITPPPAPTWYGTLSYKPGWMFHPAAGLKIKTGKAAFTTEIGYQWQQLDVITTYTGTEDIQSITYRRMCVALGVEF